MGQAWNTAVGKETERWMERDGERQKAPVMGRQGKKRDRKVGEMVGGDRERKRETE